MNGFPQQLFTQPSDGRHANSGAHLGFVDANQCHFDHQAVHHKWPHPQEYQSCTDAVPGMQNTAFIDASVQIRAPPGQMGWSADQSTSLRQVQSLRPPGEPPPGVSNTGGSAPVNVQSTWAANQPWHRPVFTNDAGIAPLQAIPGQLPQQPTVFPAAAHAQDYPILQQHGGVHVTPGVVAQPSHHPHPDYGHTTLNQQIIAQHHTYQPLQPNPAASVQRVGDAAPVQWISAVPSQVPLTLAASRLHSVAAAVPTAQLPVYHAPAPQTQSDEATFGQLPVLRNPDHPVYESTGHCPDTEPPALPKGIWARNFQQQEPTRVPSQPLPLLGQQPANYGANINPTDTRTDPQGSQPSQAQGFPSDSLFDGLDAGLADHSAPDSAKKDDIAALENVARDTFPPGLSLSVLGMCNGGRAKAMTDQKSPGKNPESATEKDCSASAAPASLEQYVNEELSALDFSNDEQPEQYQPCTAALSSDSPPQRSNMNGTDSPEPAYHSTHRYTYQPVITKGSRSQGQKDPAEFLCPFERRSSSPKASTASDSGSRSVTPSSSDSSLQTIDDQEVNEEERNTQSPSPTRNQQHNQSEEEPASTRSDTPPAVEDTSEVESGEIIDSPSLPEQPAAPPGPIQFHIQAQEVQSRPRIEPLSTPLKSMFFRPTSSHDSHPLCAEALPDPSAPDPSLAPEVQPHSSNAAAQHELQKADGAVSSSPKPPVPPQRECAETSAAAAQASLADTEARALLAASKFTGAAVRSAAARRSRRHTSVHTMNSSMFTAVTHQGPPKDQEPPQRSHPTVPTAVAPTTAAVPKGTKRSAAESIDPSMVDATAGHAPDVAQGQYLDHLPPDRPSVVEHRNPRYTRGTAQQDREHKRSRSEKPPEKTHEDKGGSSGRRQPKRTKPGNELSWDTSSPRKSRTRSQATEPRSQKRKKASKASERATAVDHSIQPGVREEPEHGEEKRVEPCPVPADNDNQVLEQPAPDFLDGQAPNKEPVDVNKPPNTAPTCDDASQALSAGGLGTSYGAHPNGTETRDTHTFSPDNQKTAPAPSPADTSAPAGGDHDHDQHTTWKCPPHEAPSADKATDDDDVDQASALSDIRDSLRQQLKHRKKRSATDQPPQPVDLATHTAPTDPPFHRPNTTAETSSHVTAVQTCTPDDPSPSTSPQKQQELPKALSPSRNRAKKPLKDAALQATSPPLTVTPTPPRPSSNPQVVAVHNLPRNLIGSSPDQEDTDVEIQEIQEIVEVHEAEEPNPGGSSGLGGLVPSVPEASDPAEGGRSVSRAEESGLVCLEFCQTGFCSLGEDHCNRVHDRDLVVPCPGFASSGHCRRQGCLLQHKVVPGLMPMCIFQFKGHCWNEDECAYAHMPNVPPRSGVCPDFLRGFCPLGDLCTLKHFTQRTLMDYFMRPQDYENLISGAERTRGANSAVNSGNSRCELGSASASSILPPSSDRAPCSSSFEDPADPPAGFLRSHADTHSGGGFINPDGRQNSSGALVQSQAATSSQVVGNDGDQDSGSGESGDPCTAVRDAAEYVRLTAPDGGPHIGGISFPSWAFE